MRALAFARARIGELGMLVGRDERVLAERDRQEVAEARPHVMPALWALLHSPELQRAMKAKLHCVTHTHCGSHLLVLFSSFFLFRCLWLILAFIHR